MLAPAAFADPTVMSAESLQKILTARHATWQAKDNWLTRLPKDQLRRILGLKNPPNTSVEFEAPYSEVSKAASKTLDWRNNNGINWVSPVLNQGNCGSCVAFASVATLETQVNVTSGIPGLDMAFSTQALFACGGGGCDMGWEPGSAAQYMQSSGVPDEACAPYTMGSTGVDASCSSICSDAASRSLKLVSYSQPTGGTKNISAVKAALAHGPLVTTMTVYADFVGYSHGIYKHTAGDALGGHAISIVGYEDSTRSWIIRNSWGTDWGDGGFAHVSWDDDSGVGEETWSYVVPQAQGYVDVETPHGRIFASGKLPFKAESTFPGTQSLQITIADDGSNPGSAVSNVLAASCATGSCASSFDTSTLPNGKYDVFATAKWNGGNTTVSQHEQLFVFNGTPRLTLSYVPADGVDLTAPVSGRIVFNLTSGTGSDSVPLSRVTLHVSRNGTDVLTKSSDLVLPQMTLGWRTPTVADGQYDIWFSGELTTNAGTTAVQTAKTHITVDNSSQNLSMR